MKKVYNLLRNCSAALALLTVLLTAIFFVPINAHSASIFSSSNARPFDFTDAFYLQNGVNPAQIVNKRNGADGLSVFDVPPDNIHNNVRVKITIPAYDHSGNIWYWYLLGEIFQTGFTNNQAGAEARQIADAFKIFVFPKASGNPLVLGNNRQADMIDLRNGYFSNDPLGLWAIVFVNYTVRANSREGRKALEDLARKNGVSTDGTPIIKSLSDLTNLTRKGFVTQTIRALDGSQCPIWSLCPVIKDPRDGVIAPDAFLAFTRNADGSPFLTERAFIDNFNCLQQTGDWCDD